MRSESPNALAGRAPMRSLAAAAGLVVVLGACTSAPPPRGAPRPEAAEPRTAPAPRARPSVPPAARGRSLADRVVADAYSLLATPYRYSGEDPRGFDCSGLTLYLFDRVGLALPRTAQSQAGVGRWVAPDELAPGDLVFFGDLRSKPYHVGLVVSDSGQPLTMIHASTSRGVVETEILSSSYWLPRLRFGRRVLPR